MLALAFLVVPVIELALIIVASKQIGFLNTVAILVVIAIAGSWLIKHEGRKVWTRFISQVNAGKVPSDDIADGVCLLGAGALMLTPGFFTDLIALLLIIPFTRAPLRRWLVRRYSGKARVVATGTDGPAFGGGFPGFGGGGPGFGTTGPFGRGRRGGPVYETTGREAADDHAPDPADEPPSIEPGGLR